LVGQGGVLVALGQDLYSAFGEDIRGDLSGLGMGMLQAGYNLIVPNYGLYGGAGWG